MSIKLRPFRTMPFAILITLLLMSLTGGCSLMPPALGGAGSVEGVCIQVHKSWSMLPVSQFPILEARGSDFLVIKSPKHFGSEQCNARNLRAFVQKNESPVLVTANITLMSAEGDICAPTPKFVMYDRGNELHNIYGFPTAPWQPMSRRVEAARRVTQERCGKVPNEIQFVARIVPQLDHAVYLQAANGRLNRVPFQFTDYFSGRTKGNDNMQLRSDDPVQEATYWDQQNKRIEAHKIKEEERANKLALGAAALAGLLYGPQSLGIQQSTAKPRSTDVILRVCNTGKIPLYVAVAEVPDLTHDHRLTSWTEIKPGNNTGLLGGCPGFFTGNSINNFYYLAFAIRKNDGSFGVVRYRLEGAEETSNTQYCLMRRLIERTGSRSELTTCRGKEKLAPFAAGLRLLREGALDVTFSIEPQDSDQIEVYLE